MLPEENPCSVCASVPLRELQQGAHLRNRIYDLPRFTLVGDTQCEFCQLVRDAIHQDPGRVENSRTRAMPEWRDIELIWHEQSAPGRRSGFRLFGTGCEVWIAFAAPASSDLPASHRRFYLCHALDSVLDLERVKGWVQQCETNHASCDLNHPLGIADLDTLRLIDVVENALVEVSESLRYVALSYVWGAVPNFRLSAVNRPRLMQPGAMTEAWEHLPMTIRDAITLTRRLGVRYLWVDSLCLLQNDDEDLRRGVHVMDCIFEQSWLTIVSAGGHDANSGLVGLHAGDRKEQRLAREVKPGIFMGVYFGPDTFLKRSVYESRAWTFQEHLLSRRILYFAGDQLFFRCRESERCETCEDDPHPSTSFQTFYAEDGYLDTILLQFPLQDYAWMLQQYTKRALTKETDVLRALAGIVRRVSDKLEYPIIQGLPAGAFDQFLLFFGRNLRRRPGFPSYSWVGWRGEVSIAQRERLNGWLDQRVWIIWYMRTPDGTEIMMPVGEINGSDQRQPFECRHLSISITRTAPSGSPWPSNTPPRPYPILQFWSLTVWLKIDDLDVFMAIAKLFDRQGLVCGVVMLDGLEDTKFFESQAPCEAVLLSESDELMPAIDDIHLGRKGPRKFYHIMLLEWSDGVAERRGIGTIRQDAVASGFEPGAQWKEITLA
ncbi:hypothetical protein OQA88_5424 [Cercophora sp. LCS_1]